MADQTRLSRTFERLREENRAAFVPFVMAGDPDLTTSLEIFRALPAAGADIIELGVAFTDPMADGPAIQAAGLRALAAGQTLAKTLEMVAAFRAENDHTPVVLMGYYNPFYAMGAAAFIERAVAAGVDGLIIVDLPPEEDAELCLPAKASGLDFVRLATPTTDAARLPHVLRNSSGFVYYVSVAGITGAGTGEQTAICAAVERLRAESGLPVGVGFGIKTTERAREVAQIADAVVVGSAIVEKIAALASDKPAAEGLEPGPGKPQNIHNVIDFSRSLAEAVHQARTGD